MGKDKRRRWKEIKTFNNVIENEFGSDCEFKGNWNSQFFKNDNPIVLELGCGKGEYTVGLANRNKNKNYIGVDIKEQVLVLKSTQKISGFLRTSDFIDRCFEKNEVDEIWLTFSDPQPKKPEKD